jgi:hypothetical protein
VPDLPDAYVGHTIPGRLRIKIPSKKSNLSYLTSLKESFSGLQGIERLDVNPATGSVIFIHNLDIGEITDYAHSNGIFSLKKSHHYRPNMHQKVSRSLGYFDRWIQSLTGGEMDMWGMSFVVLVFAGVYEISRGNFTTIPWYGAFWYAFNIFLKSSPSAG